MNDTVTSAASRSRLKRIARGCAIGCLALLLTIGVALSVFTLIMARTPHYRAQMQTWLSERSQLNIQFADIQASWRWFGPELTFTDAVVRTADGARVLAIAKRGGVGLDLWMALRTGRLSAVRFALSGTELKAVRRHDGRFQLVGAEELPELDKSRAFNLDTLPIGKFVVDDVRLSFRDLKTGRGPWVMDNVQFTLERDRNRFDLEGQASLPATLGKQFNFSAQGSGSLADVDRLQWQAQAEGKQLDLAGWAQVMPDDWIAPRRGNGSFELAARFVGAAPQGFSGHIAFVDVMINPTHWTIPLPQADILHVREDHVAPPSEPPHNEPQPGEPLSEPPPSEAVVQPEPVRYTQVGLAFTSERTAQGWQTHFDNIQLARDGLPWQPSRASLLLKFAEGNEEESTHDESLRVERVRATAQRIELDNLWPLLAYLPENEANARLRALNASGELNDVDVVYERDAADASPRMGVRVAFKRLGISPVARTPGVSGLSGVLTATGARGTVQLDSDDVALAIPHLFRTPLPVDRITGHINWTRTTNDIQLVSDDLTVQTPDGNAQAQWTLDIPHEGSPQIDARVQARDLNVLAAPRYMPAGVMQRSLLTWLDNAFTAGRVNSAELILKGPLQHFPFRDQSGLFLAKGDIEDLTLNYQPGWMPATKLHVQAEFRNTGFTAKTISGELNGLAIDGATARMKEYHDAVLEIGAQAHGDLDNSVRYVQQSPIGPAIGDLFQQLEGRGETRAKASLYLPLKDFSKRRINIDVQLQNARAGLRGITQQAASLSGNLHIFNDAVTAASITGEFLQGPFAISTAPASAGRYNVVAGGHATAPAATQFLHLPAFVKLNGEFNYRFSTPGYPQHNDDGRRSLFTVDSDLSGLNIDMPAPLNKPANAKRLLHVEAETRNADAMQLRASLGELRGLIRLQHANDGWRFDRAGVRVDGVAAALPAQPGLRIEGSLAELTLDDWLKLGGTMPVATGPAANALRVQDILRAVNINVGHLYWLGFVWPDVRGVMQATDIGWRIDVAGPQASGQVRVPYDISASPLAINMDALSLTPIEPVARGADKPNTRADPRELPSLLVDIKHFEYSTHDFGSLHAVATRTPQGLQVSTLNINGESFVGTGNGSWLQTATGQQATLIFVIDSTDVRETLQQFKYVDFIAAKHGKLETHLTWPGGLDEDILSRASGKIELQIDDGQLLNVQPGAGRVLGLLSVAALPRRLKFDFRDVLDKGLSFDSIHGNFDVTDGNAHTQNLVLRGTSAEIGIVGRIGLGARDYDQTAVVSGEFGSALPIAGAAIAANPVVGAALLLFTQVFKEPLKGVTRAYYHIGGNWDDPQVERIDADVGRASMSTTAPEGEPKP